MPADWLSMASTLREKYAMLQVSRNVQVCCMNEGDINRLKDWVWGFLICKSTVKSRIID